MYPNIPENLPKHLLLSLLFICSFNVLSLAEPTTIDDHIKVDQFGYPPDAEKIAVISNPITGFNAGDSFTAGSTYQIRDWDSDAVIFSASPTAWKSGTTHSQSGDKVWWFDFSVVTEAGSYYVFDVTNQVGSGRFEIAEDVYAEVLKAAVRTFFYQRCNFAKEAPYAETGWTDAASFVGTEQDGDCRLVTNTSASTSKDLTGGWFDAGDYNKYINFADGVVHDLLSAYEQNPMIWTDDYNIPESNNDVPDLLDELKWELDWMLKMQEESGAVLHKISSTNFNSSSPPSTDPEVRRYAPATASATISACGAFAHAAIVYQSLDDTDMQEYGDELEAAALNAWNWLQANSGQIPSSYNNSGFVNVAAEDNSYQQTANRIAAAVYLYALTDDTTYRTYFDDNWPELHLYQWYFAYAFEDEFQDAALYYAALDGSTPAIASEVWSRYGNSIETTDDNLPRYTNDDDAYRAFLTDGNHVWGSNGVKSVKGSMFYNMVYYGIDGANEDNYRKAAMGYLNYLHGVNPLGLVYLSNMGSYGAENSVTEFYHAWFTEGSALWDKVGVSTYGPAPGFLTGGVNPYYAPDGSYGGIISPPQNQPTLKSYLDWNTSYPENSWEITENAIGYQSAYIKLLSKFVSISESEDVRLKAKVWLEAAYDENTGEMKTNLKDRGLIPLQQPFNTSPWNYNGSESFAVLPANSVDWILLEVRNSTDKSEILAQAACILLKDGTIVGTDGLDGAVFVALGSGEYYISIKSRHHLAILSSNLLSLPNEMVFDFGVEENIEGGSSQLATLADGKMACLAGDFDSNGVVNVDDFNLFTNHIAELNGYSDADCNADGNVTVEDYNFYQQNASVIGVEEIRY